MTDHLMVHHLAFTLEKSIVENISYQQLPPPYSNQFLNTHSDNEHYPQSRSSSLNYQDGDLVENLIRQELLQSSAINESNYLL